MNEQSFVIAVISPERKIHEEITAAFEGDPEIEAIWTLEDYPAPSQLVKIRDASGGCVVFLDFANPIRARAVAAELDQGYPMAVTIALHSAGRPQDMVELMQLGIREVIALPVSALNANRAFLGAKRKLKRSREQDDPEARIVAFLPSRPGSGATTIGAHTAAAVARLSNSRTLLIDFDLRLGITSFLFRMHSEQSVLEALCLGEGLDKASFGQLVGRRGNLDILGSAPVQLGRLIPPGGTNRLLSIARRQYDILCVDLPGEMREHEVETLRRAQEIFLVCTAEIGNLHMAKRKADQLLALDVHSRTTVILNRAQERSSPMTIREIEQLLQLPVQFSVPTAEKEILDATQRAVPIEGKSAISKQLEAIAKRIIGVKKAPVANTKASRFIDFFSISPVRDKSNWS